MSPVVAMSFGNASLLWLLLVVPFAVVGYVLAQRRRPRYAARFTNLALLETVVPRTPSWRRHVPPIIYLTAMTTLLVAVARPSMVTDDDTKEANVMLVLDTSGSMVATDVQPTRLVAAQQSARTFLDQVPDSVRVGLVSFSGEAHLLAAPTKDRQVVRQGLASLSATGATAMGDAITLAINATLNLPTDAGTTSSTVAVTPSVDSNNTVLLVLSDGKNTLGAEPLAAADAARQHGI